MPQHELGAVIPRGRPARPQSLAWSDTAGRRPEGLYTAELGNDCHMRKSACQEVEMSRFGYRIYW
jgi:hypothetical protein